MEFNEEALALERKLPDFGPREGVDACDALEYGDAHVRDRNVQLDAFDVFGLVHFHAVQLAAPSRFQ